MEESLDIDSYINASASSSKRGRNVLFVIVTASILVFTAYWNSRQQSWINSRVRVARYTVTWFPFSDAVKSTIQSHDDSLKFDRAKAFAQLRGFNTIEEARRTLEELRRLQLEYVPFLKIPFFGVIVDVNDIGVLGGFTFAVLLMLFRFSLARELENLTLLFKEAEKRGKLINTYKLLSMMQVLSVPKGGRLH